MKISYAPDFISALKKADVRIRKSFKEHLIIFVKNPLDPQLHNHALKNIWYGYRSIHVTADYRAIYKEIAEGDDPIAYFIAFGTHKTLYRANFH